MTGEPELGPGPDVRASAWIGAWDRIEAAQKLKMDPHRKGFVADPLPELYWATITEAAVLADLARADEDPGRDAGRHLVDRQRRIDASREVARAAMERRAQKRAASDTVGITAEGAAIVESGLTVRQAHELKHGCSADDPCTECRSAISCPVRSAGGRKCIHDTGHREIHEDEHGWVWIAAGEHAHPTDRDE